MAAHSVSALLQTPSSHAGPCSKLDEPCASAIDLPVLPPTTSNTLQLYCLCMYSGHDAPQCSQSNHQNILVERAFNRAQCPLPSQPATPAASPPAAIGI